MMGIDIYQRGYLMMELLEIENKLNELNSQFIDLSNIRNAYIHKKEDSWPSDTITDIINYAKCIVKNCIKE